jgi:hypothetical protein
MNEGNFLTCINLFFHRQMIKFPFENSRYHLLPPAMLFVLNFPAIIPVKYTRIGRTYSYLLMGRERNSLHSIHHRKKKFIRNQNQPPAPVIPGGAFSDPESMAVW